jgi:ketosteroid isomerase-like protein
MSTIPSATYTPPPSRAADLLDHMLDLLSAHDVEGAVSLFADDAELEAPFVPAPLPSRTSGRPGIAALMTTVFGAYGRVEFHNRRYLSTAGGAVVVGRWRTNIEVLATGATYADEVIAVAEFGEGCIQKFSEYFNPDSLRAAGVVPPAS